MSDMVNPRLSSPATVVCRATSVVDSLALQPSTVETAMLPLILGAVLSSMLIVWVTVVLLLQASVTVYVLVTTIGQVPVLLSV